MTKALLRMLINLLLAHLAGVYVFLTLSSLGTLIAAPHKMFYELFWAPIFAWMLLPVGFLFSLPVVWPIAILLILVLKLFHQQATGVYMTAGSICGVCVVSLAGFYRPDILEEPEFLFAFVAAAIAGIVAGWIFALRVRSQSRSENASAPETAVS